MFTLRSLAIWLLIISAEFVHGILRTLFLEPLIGDFQARQISVFVGSLIILTIAYFSVQWIRAKNIQSLIVVGLIWLILTLMFEISLGRFVFGFSWKKILSDYDISKGGLLPFGLIILTLSPLIAYKLRGMTKRSD
jgi:hypothetical protein